MQDTSGTSPPKKPNALNSNANKASKIQRGHCEGLIVYKLKGTEGWLSVMPTSYITFT